MVFKAVRQSAHTHQRLLAGKSQLPAQLAPRTVRVYSYSVRTVSGTPRYLELQVVPPMISHLLSTPPETPPVRV